MSEKQGTIVQVMGPVVDVSFDGGALPELKEALEVELDGCTSCGMGGNLFEGLDAEADNEDA